MKIRFAPLALLIPVLLGVPSCQGKKKSSGTPFGSAMIASEVETSHVDEHYRFSIRGLGPQWRLLNESERAKILPHAAAMATMVQGGYGAVMVEPYEGGDLRSFTELITSNMKGVAHGFKASEIREVEFNGGKANRMSITATFQGIVFDYELMTFLHQGMAYQVLAWIPAVKGTREPLEKFIAAVKVEEGQVTTPPPPPAPDSVGIGNRISNGRFESAISGLSVAPRSPWGLMWGQTLASCGDKAETGIQRSDQGLVITVSHEPVAAEGQAQFLNSLRAFIPKNASRLGPATWSFGGEPVTFEGMLVPGSPQVRIYLGHVVRGGRGLQVKAWHIDNGVDRTAEIGEGMQAFEFLDDKAIGELRGRLENSSDAYGSAGEGFSVRNGVFRGFKEGVVWKRPEGFWQIDAGDAAHGHNEACSLQATEMTSGLRLQLVVDAHEKMTPEVFHETVVSQLKKGGFTQSAKRLEPVMVEGHEVLRTCLDHKGKDADSEYHVATVVTGGRSYQLNCFGPATVMSGPAELPAKVLAGFSFPGEKLRAVEFRGGKHRDVRMGFEMRVSSDMAPDPEAKNEIVSKIGSCVGFRGKAGFMRHIAIQNAGVGNDASLTSKLVTEIFKVNLDRASSEGSSEKSDTIAGLPASVRTGVSEGAHLKIIVFRQGGVLHMGIVVGQTERQAESLFSEYKAGFTLIP